MIQPVLLMIAPGREIRDLHCKETDGKPLTMRSHGYSTKKWKEFRAEVMELDQGRCRQCGRGTNGDVVLQVHHLRYKPQSPPWDYRYEDCETLCKGCHASVHGHIRPRFGWDFVHEEDLGDLSGTCELCGTSIRYVFWVHHPHWEPLGAGTICCDHLTGTTLATEKMKFNDRVKCFIISNRWKTSPDGIVIRQKGIMLEVIRQAGGFKLRMNGKTGNIIYPNEDAAKEKALKAIEDGSAIRFLQKKGLLS